MCRPPRSRPASDAPAAGIREERGWRDHMSQGVDIMKTSLFKYRRHVKTALRHVTVAKLGNCALSLYEQKFRRRTLRV